MSSNVPAPLRTSEVPDPAPNTPPRTPGTGYLECDFCHCKLTKSGEVYQVSPEAREYRDANEKHRKAIEKLDEEITRLRSEITAKDQEIARLKPSGSSGSRNKFL
jgi:hypothetical protein